ncbi:hypothetical protein JYU04_01940 [Dehalococcoides mccartyi]|nr:hypothetical protein [Dehalococcoides mccartyi]
MIVTRATISPKVGAYGEIENMVKTWVDEWNGQGHRVAGTKSIWGAFGTKFHIANFYDSVADADDARRKISTTDSFKNVAATLASLVDAPTGWTLSEIIVRPARMASMKYALRVALTPALGKNAEMRAVCTDWVNYLGSVNANAGLAEQIWSATGGSFSIRLPHDSLGDADDARNRTISSPEYKSFTEKLLPTMAGQPRWEVLETIASPSI